MKRHRLSGNSTQEKLEQGRKYMPVKTAAKIDALLPAVLDNRFRGKR